jgi:hypothetical protein
MEGIKQDLTTQLESVFSMLRTKLHIPTDNPLSDPPPHTEAENSSHSHNFQHHHFQRDLRLPRGNGEKLLVKGIFLGHTLWQRFMNALTLTPTIWAV